MRWTKKATVTAVVVAAAAVGIPLAVVELNQRDSQTTATPPAPTTAAATSAQPTESAGVPWVGTWAVAVHSGEEGFERQTLRQIVRTSIGGQAVRVRLSNEFGEQPLTVQNVHLAKHVSTGRIDPSTDKTATFGGDTSVTIAPGETAVSDAVEFAAAAEGDIAVSAYLPSGTGAATKHDLANRDNWVVDGDQTNRAELSGARKTGSYYFLAGLDVQNPEAAGSVVALGASITDGFGSAYNGNRRWPDLLAARLNDSGRTVGVLNAGIKGNMLLKDWAGQSALNRFERDVLAQPGVKWVIVSDDPLNDLGGANPPSGDELIAGLRQLVDRSHGAGVQVLCSTLTPFEGAGYWSERGEQGRKQVNDFIRGADSGCDAVVDQDTATHDPNSPTRYLRAYDSGDRLHPNDAGMTAIAEAVSLDAFGPAS
ncbi:MAG: SGNH/GDSL hydrolase family protein [Actinoplanes sp.]